MSEEKKSVTLWINKEIFDKFKKGCKEQELRMSERVEKFMGREAELMQLENRRRYIV